MQEKFQSLYEPIKLPNGLELPNRFVVAPMSIEGADKNGAPTMEDVNFWKRRADTAALLITGETSISLYGMTSEHQLGLFDSNLDAFKKMTAAMKSKGNKAIVQMFHGGFKAQTSYEKLGSAYGPSALDTDILGYPLTELTDEQIQLIIKQFGHATELAIEAGFDGIELSANFYLLYSFFSRYYNKRQDKWGAASLATRSALDLAVLDEMIKIIKAEAPKDFILGVRFRPEDYVVTRNMSKSDGGEVNHTLDDTIYLMHEMMKRPIDYIHSMGWGGAGAYKKLEKIVDQHRQVTGTMKKEIDGKVPLIVNGGIVNAEDMLDSLNYGDMFSFASLAVVEPDVKNKIAQGQDLSLKIGEDACLPKLLSYRADSFVSANPKIAEANPELTGNTDVSSGASQA